MTTSPNPYYVVCQDCQGTGERLLTGTHTPCDACHGFGIIRTEQGIQVHEFLKRWSQAIVRQRKAREAAESKASWWKVWI